MTDTTATEAAIRSAEDHRQALAEWIAACKDATVLGAGFIQITKEGSLKRIDPRTLHIVPIDREDTCEECNNIELEGEHVFYNI